MDARTASLSERAGISGEAAQLVARWARSLARCVVGCGLAVLWLAAMTLLARRLAGALVDPLPALTLVGLGFVLSALAVVCHLAVWQLFAGARPLRWTITAALVLSAVAVSLPGSSVIGLIGLWGLVLGQEAWAWRRELRGNEDSPPNPRPLPRGDDIRIDPPQLPMPHFPTEDISQQLTRRRGERDEIVSGWLRVALEAGQRTAAAHVAFCPPLVETPRVTLRQTEGPSARIKEGQVLTHGLRLEIKLAEPPVAATSVLVEFTAQSPLVRSLVPAPRRG
jgi:hypothetical protein